MPYSIRKSKDKDGKSIYCAYKKGADSPKACSDSKKNIRLYVAFAERSDRKKKG